MDINIKIDAGDILAAVNVLAESLRQLAAAVASSEPAKVRMADIAAEIAESDEPIGAMLDFEKALQSEIKPAKVLAAAPVAPATPAQAAPVQPAPVAPVAPAPAPAPVAVAPAPAPVAEAPAPAPVAPAAPALTINKICEACRPLSNAGKSGELIKILSELGCKTVIQLKPDQFSAFAEKLRAIGGVI